MIGERFALVVSSLGEMIARRMKGMVVEGRAVGGGGGGGGRGGGGVKRWRASVGKTVRNGSKPPAGGGWVGLGACCGRMNGVWVGGGGGGRALRDFNTLRALVVYPVSINWGQLQ